MVSKTFRAVMAASVLIGALVQPAAADDEDRRVTIVNKTGVTMVRFYGSNSNSDSWEDDKLGLDTLTSGSALDIDFDDGSGLCIFDFKAVFDDGDELVRHKVNVCEIGTYTYE